MEAGRHLRQGAILGLAEVNSAVSARWTGRTQQNASMVEQSTAAAKALADEAQMLRSLISQFTFKQAAGSPAQALHATAKAMAARGARSGRQGGTPAARLSGRPQAALRGDRARRARQLPSPARRFFRRWR